MLVWRWRTPTRRWRTPIRRWHTLPCPVTNIQMREMEMWINGKWRLFDWNNNINKKEKSRWRKWTMRWRKWTMKRIHFSPLCLPWCRTIFLTGLSVDTQFCTYQNPKSSVLITILSCLSQRNFEWWAWEEGLERPISSKPKPKPNLEICFF